VKNPISYGWLQSQGYFGEVYPEPVEGFHFASVRYYNEEINTCTWR